MNRIETRLRKLESIVKRVQVTAIPLPGGPIKMNVPQAREAMAQLKREIDQGIFPQATTERERAHGAKLIAEARAIDVKPAWLEYGFDPSGLSQAERLAIGFAIRSAIVQ